jgi:hypothetical protein
MSKAADQPANRGWFKRGDDPRRHRFTEDECSAGFWAAVESITARYPDAVMADGRHIVCNFLKSKQRETIH